MIARTLQSASLCACQGKSREAGFASTPAGSCGVNAAHKSLQACSCDNNKVEDCSH